MLVAFSLWKNSKALLSLERSPNDITTIHGIRFINAGLLLISHKSMALFYNPYMNKTKMVEVNSISLNCRWLFKIFCFELHFLFNSKDIGEYISVIARAAAIYTDAFIMLSGLLTSFAIIDRLKKNQPSNIGQEYMSRFLRIVPMLGALILFCTFILPELGQGPQWDLVVNRHAEICKRNWWRNFLFIHNYFGFSEMVRTILELLFFQLL